ncbi:DUF222 domain-containing protein [Janibacter hoylei]
MLAELAAARPEGLSEADLLEVITLGEALKGSLAGVQARATARFVAERDARIGEQKQAGEISAREATSRRRGSRCDVALARRCSPSQADRHVGLAKALVEDLPHTLQALTSGEVGEWRATIVARETACLSHEDHVIADERLSGCLTTLGDRQLRAAAHRVTVDLDQESLVREEGAGGGVAAGEHPPRGRWDGVVERAGPDGRRRRGVRGAQGRRAGPVRRDRRPRDGRGTCRG